MFHAGNKNSFDMGLEGPEGHVVRFFFNSDDFFSKLHPLVYTNMKQTVTRNIALITLQKLAFYQPQVLPNVSPKPWPWIRGG